MVRVKPIGSPAFLKRCTQCEAEKQLTEYYRDKSRLDGYFPYCKSCSQKRDKANYRRDKDKFYARSASWRKRNPERAKKIASKTVERYIQKHPEKRKAHIRVTNALADGKIKRSNCLVCKRLYKLEVKAEAHHCDYNKPLDVLWLCRKHHQAWHRVFLAEQPNG